MTNSPFFSVLRELFFFMLFGQPSNEPKVRFFGAGASDESRLASSWHHVGDNLLSVETSPATHEPVSTQSSPLFTTMAPATEVPATEAPPSVEANATGGPAAKATESEASASKAPLATEASATKVPKTEAPATEALPTKANTPDMRVSKTSGTVDIVSSIESAVSAYKQGDSKPLEDLGLGILRESGSLPEVRMKKDEKPQEDEPVEECTEVANGTAPRRSAAARLSLEKSKASNAVFFSLRFTRGSWLKLRRFVKLKIRCASALPLDPRLRYAAGKSAWARSKVTENPADVSVLPNCLAFPLSLLDLRALQSS